MAKLAEPNEKLPAEKVNSVATEVTGKVTFALDVTTEVQAESPFTF